MNFYTGILRPILFRLDAEAAHDFSMSALALAGHFPRLLAGGFGGAAPRIETEVFGIRFPNPVGLAAGMDKNALALPAWEALGFGSAEIGTITAKPQPGNPRPRLFRYPAQGAFINRFGFNNDGADAVAARLARLKASGRWPRIPVGINLGKSKVTPASQAPADYRTSFERLLPFGDYFVINVSSPNTPGLRELQHHDALSAIVVALRDFNTDKPLLVKIAPDLSPEQLDSIIPLLGGGGVSGVIATNTTLDHSAIPADRDEQGGLSGAPLAARATGILRQLKAATDLPIIASGGIMNGDDARNRMEAGAALVQIYTGFVYRGPGLIREICRALDAGRP